MSRRDKAAPGEFVAGVDEAGRGPLAGPVACAAVILDPRRRIRGLGDSKALCVEERERGYARQEPLSRPFRVC